MKTLTIVLIVLLYNLGIDIYAQKLKPSDVPSKVISKFEEMYPLITKVKWEQEKSLYKAKFTEYGTETGVLYDKNGNLIQTEYKIFAASLPAGVNDYINSNLPGKVISESYRIKLPDGTNNYKAEIEKEYYYFDSEGNFIKKETEDSDKDNKDK